MTTASTLDSPTLMAYDQVELAFTLELAPGSDSALLRTLALLHGRRCSITEVDYRSRLKGDDLRLRAPAAHAHCVGGWLSALVDVRRVNAPARPGRPDGHTGKAQHRCAASAISKTASSRGSQ